uniref:Uncharacterized protein n=1 Tax=Oryza meridionalis TaxID=40149 RepID=A0A0E0C6Y9_9ORYZ
MGDAFRHGEHLRLSGHTLNLRFVQGSGFTRSLRPIRDWGSTDREGMQQPGSRVQENRSEDTLGALEVPLALSYAVRPRPASKLWRALLRSRRFVESLTDTTPTGFTSSAVEANDSPPPAASSASPGPFLPAGPPTPHLRALSLPVGSPSSPRGGIWSCTSTTAQLEQSTGRSGLGSGTEWTRRRWSASGQPLVRIWGLAAAITGSGASAAGCPLLRRRCGGNHRIWGHCAWMRLMGSEDEGVFDNNRPSSADSSPSLDRSTGFQAACIAASRRGGCTVAGFSYGSFVVFVACCGVLCVVDSGRGPEADYVVSPRKIGIVNL